MAEEAGRERGCRRRRRLEGVAATAGQGGAVLVEVLVCEGDSRRTARVGGSSRQAGRAVGEGKPRLAMHAGRSGPLDLSLLVWVAPWLLGSRGKGSGVLECVGRKCGSARAAARGVRDRNLLDVLLRRLAHDHCFLLVLDG